MIIRVQADAEKAQEVLNAVRDLGVQVVMDNGDPQEEALFIVSRINKQLDNLGQLRHLNKITQHLLSIKQAAESFTTFLRTKNIRHEYEAARNMERFRLCNQRRELQGVKPMDYNVFISVMTTEELETYFVTEGKLS